MKSSLLLLVIFITSFSFSQDSTKIRKVGTPIITSKVYLGKSIVVENFKIEFIEVIQDSRCPKGVNCVWAGEVLIFVDLYKDGKKVERKKITLSPKIELQKRIGNLFFSEKLSLTVLNVLPHPNAKAKIQSSDYYLLLDKKH